MRRRTMRGRARRGLTVRRLALALALGCLMCAAPAQAADITLKSPDGRVAIDFDPLRISFLDNAGHTVLRQVAPAGCTGSS